MSLDEFIESLRKKSNFFSYISSETKEKRVYRALITKIKNIVKEEGITDYSEVKTDEGKDSLVFIFNKSVLKLQKAPYREGERIAVPKDRLILEATDIETVKVSKLFQTPIFRDIAKYDRMNMSRGDVDTPDEISKIGYLALLKLLRELIERNILWIDCSDQNLGFDPVSGGEYIVDAIDTYELDEEEKQYMLENITKLIEILEYSERLQTLDELIAYERTTGFADELQSFRTCFCEDKTEEIRLASEKLRIKVLMINKMEIYKQAIMEHRKNGTELKNRK